MVFAGVGSILDTVAKDTEDTPNLYLNLYLRYIFGSLYLISIFRYLVAQKIRYLFAYFLAYQRAQLEDNHIVLLHKQSYSKSNKI